MVEQALDQRLFALFADLLEYPRSVPLQSAQECEALIKSDCPEAEELVSEFRTFAEETPVERMQEIYTFTFDLDASFHLFLGYHLLGESYKRSSFMLGLKERYKAHGFEMNTTELPDHLAVVTRFLSVCPDKNEAEEIARDAILPTLEKMLKKINKDSKASDDEGEEEKKHRIEEKEKEKQQIRPYKRVLEAFALALRKRYPIEMNKEVDSHV